MNGLDSGNERTEGAFEARLIQLIRDVALAAEGVARIDPDLCKRVQGGIATDVATCRGELEELSERAERGDVHPADAWAELRVIGLKVDALVEESLVLVHGAALRTAKLDEGYCALADALVDEMVNRTPIPAWNSFTVLGRFEFYQRASRVIRVRYPASSLWDLPVVAHELGHFVGLSLISRQDGRTLPLVVLAERLGATADAPWLWLQELFADAFAAYVMGPAYGYASVYLGFDPVAAHIEDDTHPAPALRLQLILSVLRGLEGDGIHEAAADIEALWGKLTRDSEADSNGETQPEDWVPALSSTLTEHLPASAYGTWQEVQRLSSGLRRGQATATSRSTLVDILNAGWLCRRDATNWMEVADLARDARRLCEAVIPGGK